MSRVKELPASLRFWLGLESGWEALHGGDPSPSARHIYRFLCALLKVCVVYFTADVAVRSLWGSAPHRWVIGWLGLNWLAGKYAMEYAKEVMIAFSAGLWAILSWALFRRDLRVLYRLLGRRMPWRRAVKVVTVCFLIYTGAYIGIQKAWLPEGKLIRKSMAKHTLRVYDIMPKQPSAAGLKAASRFVIVPFGEELLYRGAILIALLYLFGKWPAAIGSSFLFGYGHFDQWGHLGWFPVVCTAIFGLISCIILFKTGRIRWCILFHSLDLMHNYLFRVAIPPLGIEF